MNELAAHQTYALMCMESNDNLGIFYDPGCGKTMVALSWTVDALKRGKIQDALVVCPAALVGSWRTAIEELPTFKGFTEDDVKLLKEKMFITSFQKLYRSTKKAVHHRNGTVSYKRIITLREEVDKEWGVMFIDESHHIGAHDSVQTDICMKMAHVAKYRYILSGTPVLGGGGAEDFSKLYGQFEFLEPGIFKTWTNFKAQYVEKFDRWGGPREYKVNKCRALLQSKAIAVKLEDCFDMPDFTETTIKVELAEKKAYVDIRKGALEEYKIDFINAGGKFVKVMQVCSGHIKRDENDYLKLKTNKDDALREIIEGTSSKVIIFCRFRASVDRVRDICSKYGKTSVFDGRSKEETWRDLQYGDSRFLVCQYQSGGEGLNLYASDTMVFFEPTLSSRDLYQAKSRIYRKGQTRNCRFIYLVTEKTIETNTMETVRKGVDVTVDMMASWSRGEVFSENESD